MTNNEQIKHLLKLRRFLDVDKTMFLGEVQDIMEANGYDAVVSRDKSGRVTSSNLLFGNIHEAEMMLVSYYDTPMRMPGFLKYTPLNFKKKVMNNFILRTIKETITVLVGIICFSIATQFFWSDGVFQVIDVVMAFLIIFLMVVVKTVLQLPSRNFTKRNNSSLELMMQLMLELDVTTRRKILFVFADNGTADMQGDRVVADMLVEFGKAIPVIMLDSIAADGALLVEHMESTKSLAHRIVPVPAQIIAADELPTETISMYQNGLLITRGEKDKKDFIIKDVNTNKDTTYDVQQFNEAKVTVLSIIKTICK